MRIDSMDASAVAIPKVQNTEQTTPVKEPIEKPVETKNTGSTALASRNISSLSEYEKKEMPISDRAVINAIEKANKAISGANRRFEFSIHEKTKEIMVKVINSDTNEIVREFPPEKILDMVAKMWEMAGILVDERR